MSNDRQSDETKPEFSNLVSFIESQTSEGLRLEFKSIDLIRRGKSKESVISKAVSAFANSAGGSFILGIATERTDEGVKLSLVGDKPAEGDKTEWLETLVRVQTYPSVESYQVHSIANSAGERFYWIEVQRSTLAPHQAVDHMYYKRNGSHSVPMEHFEIEDVRGRSFEIEYPLDVRVVIEKGALAELKVTNRGSRLVTDCRFKLSGNPAIHQATATRLEKHGLSFVYPNEAVAFHLGGIHELLRGAPPALELAFEYQIAGDLRREVRTFDFHDFDLQVVHRDESVEGVKKIEKAIGALAKSLNSIESRLQTIASGFSSSGVHLSDSSLNAIRGNRDASDRKYDLSEADAEGLRDILGVANDTAREIVRLYRFRNQRNNWEEYLANLPTDIQKKIGDRFEI